MNRETKDANLINQINNQQALIENLNAEMEDKIKEIETLRQQFIQSERIVFIGQLTAGILHEIKNPLNFVNNFSVLSLEMVAELNDAIEKINEKIDNDAKDDFIDIATTLEGNLKKIHENGDRAQRIIFGMLAQTRDKQDPEFLETHINQLVDDFTKLAYQGIRGNDSTFNLIIKTKYDAKLETEKVSAPDLSRVIINIVNNACYALNEKKKMRGSDFAPELLVSTTKHPDSFEIVIKDNGTGMPQEVTDKIFNAFYTTKPVGQGTGLGLSLCNDIVTKTHKGSIKVNSQHGEYTEFIIQIPTIK